MTRLCILIAVLAFLVAGAEVFSRVNTGQMDGSSNVFVLTALVIAFAMLALLFQRVGRLETALNQKTTAPKDS